jgi:thiol-disulfide isomerase/thioredoxin
MFGPQWCGPCRIELPHLQKLYDRLKDDNTGIIEPFLKEHSLTFPVVPALAYVQGFPANDQYPPEHNESGSPSQNS